MQGIALFKTQGFHGTGLKEILTAVRIPKGSFYSYFASKEDFAAELVGVYIASYLVRLQDCLLAHPGDALTGLRRYVDELIGELEDSGFRGGCLLGNFIGELSDTSDICRIALQKAVHRYRDGWEAGFVRAQREGAVRSDKPARELADLWLSAWQGALLRMQIEQSALPLKQCKNELLNGFFLSR